MVYAAFQMFNVFVGKLESAFISIYDSLTGRAGITREAKERDQFLCTHGKHLLHRFST